MWEWVPAIDVMSLFLTEYIILQLLRILFPDLIIVRETKNKQFNNLEKLLCLRFDNKK